MWNCDSFCGGKSKFVFVIRICGVWKRVKTEKFSSSIELSESHYIVVSIRKDVSYTSKKELAIKMPVFFSSTSLNYRCILGLSLENSWLPPVPTFCFRLAAIRVRPATRSVNTEARGFLDKLI